MEALGIPALRERAEEDRAVRGTLKEQIQRMTQERKTPERLRA